MQQSNRKASFFDAFVAVGAIFSSGMFALSIIAIKVLKWSSHSPWWYVPVSAAAAGGGLLYSRRNQYPGFFQGARRANLVIRNTALLSLLSVEIYRTYTLDVPSSFRILSTACALIVNSLSALVHRDPTPEDPWARNWPSLYDEYTESRDIDRSRLIKRKLLETPFNCFTTANTCAAVSVFFLNAEKIDAADYVKISLVSTIFPLLESLQTILFTRWEARLKASIQTHLNQWHRAEALRLLLERILWMPYTFLSRFIQSSSFTAQLFLYTWVVIQNSIEGNTETASEIPDISLLFAMIIAIPLALRGVYLITAPLNEAGEDGEDASLLANTQYRGYTRLDNAPPLDEEEGVELQARM